MLSFRCFLCLRTNQTAALLDKFDGKDDVGHDVVADAPESLLVVKSLSRKLVEGGGNAARADSIEQKQYKPFSWRLLHQSKCRKAAIAEVQIKLWERESSRMCPRGARLTKSYR